MDPIGNLLTSIRNAEMASHSQTKAPKSKLSLAILTILKDTGYIIDFSTEDRVIHIILKQGVRNTYKRMSKPGRRLFTAAQDIPIVLRGLGIVIVSTSKGLMTGKDARKQNLGGELICLVS